MRDLTVDELKIAPDWATHYSIDIDDSVAYASEDMCWWEGLGSPQVNHVFKGYEVRKINRKPFDITKHEIVDCGYIGIKHDKNLYVKKSGFTIDKERAIALAKALGVTADDLMQSNKLEMK